MKVLRFPEKRVAEIVESENPKAEGGVSVAKTITTNVSAGTEMAFFRGTAPSLKGRFNSYKLYEEPSDGEGVTTYPMQADDPGTWWMGYGAVGRIVEVGPEEKTLKEGDLVFTEGGHKEYQASDRFYRLPADVNPAHASLLMLMRIAFTAMLDARVKLLDEVVLFGMGTLGQLLLKMCKLSGASVIAVDALDSRLELASARGADTVFNVAKDGDIGSFIQEKTSGRGADIVLEASGHPKALGDAIRCCGDEGTVTVVSFYQGGMPDLHLGREFHLKRITLRSSQVMGANPAFSSRYSFDVRMEKAIDLLGKLNLDPIITHRIAFDGLPEALGMIDQNPQDCLAVVVEYGEKS